MTTPPTSGSAPLLVSAPIPAARPVPAYDGTDDAQLRARVLERYGKAGAERLRTGQRPPS